MSDDDVMGGCCQRVSAGGVMVATFPVSACQRVSADDVMVATFPVSACQRVSADDVTVAMALLMRRVPRGTVLYY